MIIETILLILFKVLLDYSYIFYVNKAYVYQGFIADYNMYKMIFGTIVIVWVFLLFRLNNRKKSIENVIIMILIFSIIIPTSVLYGTENSDTIFFILINLGFAITIMISRLPIVKISKISIISDKGIVRLVLLFMITLILCLIFFEGMPSLKALNLNNVYDIRSSNQLPTILNYFSNWQTKVFSLFLLGYSLFYKKRLLMILTLGFQLMIFMITAHKIILFSPFLLILLYIILKRFENFNMFYMIAMNLGVLIAFLAYKLNISEWPASLFIRRMHFVPVKNTNFVFEYFSDLEKVHLSNSILRGIFQYKYDKGIYYLIGEKYYGNPNTNANASYFADSFVQFGLIGILIISIVLGIILWVLKNISYDKPLIIVTGCVIIGFFGLVDTALQTSLITGGIVIGMLLIILINNKNTIKTK